MDLENLFVNYPDLYPLVAELVKYSDTVAIPVHTVVIEDDISNSRNAVYPDIITNIIILQMIMRLLKNRSFSFISQLMGKYRFVSSVRFNEN